MIDDTRNGTKRNALLADVIELTTAHLEEHEVSPAAAAVTASALADRLADYWGGQVIVFPRDFLYKLAKLEIEIYGNFTGHNHDELARSYRMTTRGIRKLIARVRAKLAKQSQSSQGDLLDL